MTRLLFFIYFILYSSFFTLHSSALPFFKQWTVDDGLLNNQILTITQMNYGQTLVRGDSCFSIFKDGSCIVTYKCPSDKAKQIKNFHGGYLTYVDNENHVWIKQWEACWCFDLTKKRFVDLSSVSLDDVYTDHYGNCWQLADSVLTGTYAGRKLQIDVHGWNSEIRHTETDNDCFLYIFDEDGLIRCYDTKTCKLIYERRAYPLEEKEEKPLSSSAFAIGPDSAFYQLQNQGRSIFLKFDTHTRTWSTIFDTYDKRGFHSLCLPDSTTAIIGCSAGVWFIDLKSGNMTLSTDIPLQGGDPLHTGINAVANDGHGGLWLGTYGNGLLHADTWQDIPSRVQYYIMYLLGAILCIVLIGWWYTRRKRNQREAQLMERIRELMQSVNSTTEDRSVSEPKDTSDESLANKEQEDTDTLSEDDRLFIQKATALVEQNINSMHGYNVDELARDMAMERTGLYRHLTRIIKQSPSAFIHGIRMERADNLLRTTNMSITDIAEKLGFSTPSYFTKCYKSYYGVKPSEIQRDNQ